MRVFRRTLFVALCLGIGLALLLAPGGHPHNPLQPPKPDSFYCVVGAASGLGMLIWCFVFRRHEQVLARCGWIMAAIGLLIACYLPPMT